MKNATPTPYPITVVSEDTVTRRRDQSVVPAGLGIEGAN
jgi:hypothetical protein